VIHAPKPALPDADTRGMIASISSPKVELVSTRRTETSKDELERCSRRRAGVAKLDLLLSRDGRSAQAIWVFRRKKPMEIEVWMPGGRGGMFSEISS